MVPAFAGHPIVEDGHVADLPGKAIACAEQGPVQHQPCADALIHLHIDEIPVGGLFSEI